MSRAAGAKLRKDSVAIARHQVVGKEGEDAVVSSKADLSSGGSTVILQGLRSLPFDTLRAGLQKWSCAPSMLYGIQDMAPAPHCTPAAISSVLGQLMNGKAFPGKLDNGVVVHDLQQDDERRGAAYVLLQHGCIEIGQTTSGDAVFRLTFFGHRN